MVLILFDIVLFDIDLWGKIFGIEVVEVIQEKYVFFFIFFIVLVDVVILEWVKRIMFYGYIVKFFNENDLCIVIELVLY